MPYPVIFLFYFLLDAVLVYPPHQFFVCDPVLPFYDKNVSETFVYSCLEFHGSCLGYSPCLRAVEQRAFHIGVENSDLSSCIGKSVAKKCRIKMAIIIKTIKTSQKYKNSMFY